MTTSRVLLLLSPKLPTELISNERRIYRNWQSKYGMAGAKPLRHFGKARAAGARKLNSQVSSNAEGAVVLAVPRESREASQHRHAESAPMQSAELSTYYDKADTVFQIVYCSIE